MLWEMVKIGVSVAMLVLAPRIVPALSWPALLVAMVVCMKVYWFALLWRGRRSTRQNEHAESRDMAAEEHAPTAGEYIVHHLTHLQNQQAEGRWSTSRSSTSTRCSSRSLLGVLGCWLLWLAARKATSGVPGRFQAAVEILVEMVDTQAKGIVHNAAQPQVRRAAGAHGVRLDLPAERDGPAAGRPAARGSGSRSTAPPATTRTTPTCASCPPPTSRSRWACRSACCWSACSTTSRSRALGGWVHELFAAPFGASHCRCCGPFNFADADRSSSSPRPSRTACGCSATCTPAN